VSTDAVQLFPSSTFGEDRLCASGSACVTVARCGRPTVLSRFNPGPVCYCCRRRAKKAASIARSVSTHELMTERHGIAA
jgi:hypothetical protein